MRDAHEVTPLSLYCLVSRYREIRPSPGCLREWECVASRMLLERIYSTSFLVSRLISQKLFLFFFKGLGWEFVARPPTRHRFAMSTSPRRGEVRGKAAFTFTSPYA